MTLEEEKKILITDNLEFIKTGQGVHREITQAHERVRERALGYTYQLITAIGIVAGFGFTALSSVLSIKEFFLGEILLFSAMAVGMWFARAAFIKEIEYYYKWQQEVGQILENRMQIGFDLSIEEIKQKMENSRIKEQDLFKDNIKTPDLVWLKVLFILFILGGLLLLLSFINICKIF